MLAALAPHTPDFVVLLEDLSAIPDEQLKGTALVRSALLLLAHARKPDLRQRLPGWAALFAEVVRSNGWQAMALLLQYVLGTGWQKLLAWVPAFTLVPERPPPRLSPLAHRFRPAVPATGHPGRAERRARSASLLSPSLLANELAG